MMLAACHSNVPLDLQLENLSVVSLNESPQLLPWIGESEKIDRGKIKILEIDFSSDLDIVEFAKKNLYHVSYTAYLCEGLQKKLEIYSPGNIRVGNESLNGATYFGRDTLRDFRNSRGKITYGAVVPIAGNEINSLYPASQSKDKLFPPLYDPQKYSSDICIQLGGGAMWTGGSFSSNLIVVPRAVILEAMKHKR